jgi:hypothetical protein
VKRRSNIFLADALAGLSTLGIRDPALAREVMRMLSLDRLEVGASTSLGGAWAPTPAPARAADKTTSATQDRVDPQPPPVTFGGARRAVLRKLAEGGTSAQPPAWLIDTKAVPRAAGPTPPGRAPEPLFPPTQTRGLLTAAISTWDADGPIDVTRVADMLARLEPIRELPREITASVRRGVQVLIDTGMGMGPYRADVAQLVGHVARLVAPDQLTRLYFTGCPSRECAAPGDGTMRPWQPPPRGTPLLVFSDLGIGRPPGTEARASVDEWLDFAVLARTAGCGVIALVPYGPRRWPRPLTRAMHLVHWDRRTTAAMVRRGLAMTERLVR